MLLGTWQTWYRFGSRILHRQLEFPLPPRGKECLEILAEWAGCRPSCLEDPLKWLPLGDARPRGRAPGGPPPERRHRGRVRLAALVGRACRSEEVAWLETRGLRATFARPSWLLAEPRSRPAVGNCLHGPPPEASTRTCATDSQKPKYVRRAGSTCTGLSGPEASSSLPED